MTQRDINLVINEKITEYNKILREVQALRLVAPLLTEPENGSAEKVDVQQLIVPEEQKRNMWP